jgi:hypothetical protein
MEWDDTCPKWFELPRDPRKHHTSFSLTCYSCFTTLNKESASPHNKQENNKQERKKDGSGVLALQKIRPSYLVLKKSDDVKKRPIFAFFCENQHLQPEPCMSSHLGGIATTTTFTARLHENAVESKGMW